ncbi:hypothetical protein MP228_011681 [Amoeboaphelidium protococcarum]|nr:hypothetical protein MP228_011681 [Amoeboaphelidium protococcarum]
MIKYVLTFLVLCSLLIAAEEQHILDDVLETIEGEETVEYILSSYDQISVNAENRLLTKQVKVLAYVTPWNSHGYDVAVKFRSKFDIISPVWFQIRPRDGGGYDINGEHDVDAKWIQRVKYGNYEFSQQPSVDGSHKVEIMPRFRLELQSQTDAINLLKATDNPQLVKQLVKSILKLCKKNNFDGIVLEIDLPQYFVGVIQLISKHLRKDGLELILVIPPSTRFKSSPGQQSQQIMPFSSVHFSQLFNDVSYFSLMTYDYSGNELPGPNAPLSWISDEVDLLCGELSESTTQNACDKILVGMNMYGYIFDPSSSEKQRAIIGTQFIDELKTSSQYAAHWDEKNEECRFEDSIQGTVIYYPTKKSIRKRLQFVSRSKTGVSLWEIGQGLDYFYDIF